ncbi:MAG: DUF5615 family PIN-like protein [Limnothrix sp. RL_2_0]|nr:DUF5615 family PIN-like protein [Limnothrix sp. RL_2_0]
MSFLSFPDLPVQQLCNMTKNATPDTDINVISLRERRIVITKDSNFWDSFYVSQEPYKLLLVTTGNISNKELESLFVNNLDQLVYLLEHHSLIEISRDSVIVHQ